MNRPNRNLAPNDLLSACERALFEAARAEARASRQVVRAAARRFVRRHRREDGYLRWVLRRVAASSALAVALLGLGARVASAEATLFAARTSAANPLDGLDLGSYARPAHGDLDGDGDLDLVAGRITGSFAYYENSGSAANPAFTLRTGAADPLDGEDVGSWSSPSLGDLDGDGDLDLVSGEYGGTFRYYENTGSAVSPSFVQRSGAANPLDGQDVGYYSSPALGDLDGDGDLDLIAGEVYGSFRYYENTGNAASPVFVLRTGAANPLNGEDLGWAAVPTLGDLDGDGDLDLVAGENDAGFVYYENTGSAASPSFVRRSGAASPLDGEEAGGRSSPILGDLDGDGDLDLVAGRNSGAFAYFENLSGDQIERTGAANPLDGQDAGYYPSPPALGDLDGDGDLDLVSGEYAGTFRYFENTGSAVSPSFVQRTGAANPLDGQDAGYYSSPALGDLDGDGDLDLIAGEAYGSFRYYENTGNAASPVFVERTGTANPLGGEDVGFSAIPTLGDLDGDGDLDLIAGEFYGGFRYYENTGNAASPIFVLRTGAANPLDGEDVGGRSGPALGDVDGDGDLDLVAGEDTGVFNYYENTGSEGNPAFVPRTGAANPLDGQDAGGISTATLGDLDGDGDLDVVAGAFSTSFFYYENAIVQASPSFHELTGGANPLDGQAVAGYSDPALGDIDGDGDLDLVSGEYDGAFRYYENTGDIESPVFVLRSGGANPFASLDAGFYSSPALGDLDGDGDLDLVAGEYYGEFRYYENIGSILGPTFVLRTGPANPLDGEDVGSFARPALGDLDGDGDLDLLAGEYAGGFHYYENTGSAVMADFVLRSGASNPLDGEDVGGRSTVALGDLDGDGDLDLVAGESSGVFNDYENTGSVESPVFAARVGADNPLDGQDVGLHSNQALGDLDGDGDLDLVTGDKSGSFHTFYLPEPTRGSMLAAGLALLGALDWWRRKRPG